MTQDKLVLKKIFILSLVALGIIGHVSFRQFANSALTKQLGFARGQVLGTQDQLGPEIIRYELRDGWNLVGLPIIPDGFSTAVEMMQHIAVSGGYATNVVGWDGDRWIEVTIRGEHQFGNDFPLEPGKAYFVRAHTKTSWAISGQPLPADQLSLKLESGWNLVSMPGQIEQTASQVMTDLNGNTDSVIELNRFKDGVWDPFVRRYYSADDIQTYGDNFTIELERGYLLRKQ